jgi:hypothetical protein
MLSVLIYGRNDEYGATAQRRSALSINAFAEIMADDDEIIFVDYNTEDHKLTFPETIADTLTSRARGLLKVVRVRPRHHSQLTSPGALPVVESIARNIGLQHSDRANRWILSTNPDVVLVPPAEGLRALLERLDDGYYAAPRFELPRMLWQRLPRQDPVGVQKAVARFAASLHLDEEVRHYLPTLGYDAPGDFQLVLRHDLMEIGGFDEAMQRGWHIDANLMARLGLKYGAPGSLAGRLRVYHCEHTADTMAKHSAGRSEDRFETFVTNVQTSIANAGRPWGGEGLEFEVFKLDEVLRLDTARTVAEVIGARQGETYKAVYGPESFGRVQRVDAHTLTFLVDRVFPLERGARLLWIGGESDIRVLFGQALERMGFERPLINPEESGAIEGADLVLLDNPAPEAPLEAVARFESHLDSLVTLEAERRDRGLPARQVIAINAIHCDLESFLIDWFDVVLCPFTTRLRPAQLRSPEAQNSSWLGALSVGVSGRRDDKCETIAIQPGEPGHVFYGPYRKLPPGRYRASVNWAPQPGQSGNLVLEVVQGETFLAQSDCSIKGSDPSGELIDFIIPRGQGLLGGGTVQIRLWTDGNGAGVVTAVNIERH